MVKLAPFGKNRSVAKTPVNYSLVWFIIFTFVPPKYFFISNETKRSRYSSFEQK